MDTLLSAGAFREHPWDLPRFSPPLGLCTWLSVPSSLPLPFCSVPRGFTQGASPHLSLSFPLSGSGVLLSGFWDTCLSLWLLHPPLLPLFTPLCLWQAAWTSTCLGFGGRRSWAPILAPLNLSEPR